MMHLMLSCAAVLLLGSQCTRVLRSALLGPRQLLYCTFNDCAYVNNLNDHPQTLQLEHLIKTSEMSVGCCRSSNNAQKAMAAALLQGAPPAVWFGKGGWLCCAEILIALTSSSYVCQAGNIW
jgi:hypothetical protein